MYISEHVLFHGQTSSEKNVFRPEASPAYVPKVVLAMTTALAALTVVAGLI